MKLITTFFSFIFFVSCASSKETNFTASTPASSLVRNFLGIPLTDSIDFIRWKLIINDDQYSLDCNYGVGKPNTNGFYEGGKKVAFSGSLKKENNIYTFYHDKQILKFVELNSNLLHILKSDNTLMIGSSGWSYVINNLTPATNDRLTLTPKKTIIKDSTAFQGRTPCGVPNVLKSQQCYKLKW